MTVTVQKTDGKMATVYWNVSRWEETPTFLKLTGEGIVLIPLQDVLDVYIGDIDESDMG